MQPLFSAVAVSAGRPLHSSSTQAKCFHMNGRTDARPPRPLIEFLVDTETYRGISRDFEPLCGLLTRKLSSLEPLSVQWLNAPAVQAAVGTLLDKNRVLEMVIAGWVEQEVLEFHCVRQGDRSCLTQVLDVVDMYRPDQDGDICFYLADIEYQQVLATTFSFEDATISAATYRRRP